MGAGGRVGGVRVPLAAAMVSGGWCWGCARDGVGWNALRAAGGVVSRSSSAAFPRRDSAGRDANNSWKNKNSGLGADGHEMGLCDAQGAGIWRWMVLENWAGLGLGCPWFRCVPRR